MQIGRAKSSIHAVRAPSILSTRRREQYVGSKTSVAFESANGSSANLFGLLAETQMNNEGDSEDFFEGQRLGNRCRTTELTHRHQ
jgi:hypothetical protein